MLTAIRPSHRRKTPLARLTGALPSIPHTHGRRRLPMGAGTIVRAGLVMLLVGTALIFRDKLASILSRANGHVGRADAHAEQAADVSGANGHAEQAPGVPVEQ
jgi:hypothetical protein